MAEWIAPGTSALLLLADAGFHPDVIDEMKRFDGIGRVAVTTLPHCCKAQIEAALGQARTACAPERPVLSRWLPPRATPASRLPSPAAGSGQAHCQARRSCPPGEHGEAQR